MSVRGSVTKGSAISAVTRFISNASARRKSEKLSVEARNSYVTIFATSNWTVGNTIVRKYVMKDNANHAKRHLRE
jgi:hypothetical protein